MANSRQDVWGWTVSFATGYSNGQTEMIDFHRVRCVRDSRP